MLTRWRKGAAGLSPDASSRADDWQLAAPTRRPLGFGCQAADFNHDGHLDLAMLNGHLCDAFNRLPQQLGGTTSNPPNSNTSNRMFRSRMVAILPFVEQQRLHEQISNPAIFNGTSYPAQGPAPWVRNYEPNEVN
ncbi:MAG: DUF1559 domain-containing protein, partial [Planctomycetota bacterium]